MSNVIDYVITLSSTSLQNMKTIRQPDGSRDLPHLRSSYPGHAMYKQHHNITTSLGCFRRFVQTISVNLRCVLWSSLWAVGWTDQQIDIPSYKDTVWPVSIKPWPTQLFLWLRSFKSDIKRKKNWPRHSFHEDSVKWGTLYSSHFWILLSMNMLSASPHISVWISTSQESILWTTMYFQEPSPNLIWV